MPSEEDKWLRYIDVSKQLKVSFVIHADFECILEKIYRCQSDPMCGKHTVHLNYSRLKKRLKGHWNFRVWNVTGKAGYGLLRKINRLLFVFLVVH